MRMKGAKPQEGDIDIPLPAVKSMSNGKKKYGIISFRFIGRGGNSELFVSIIFKKYTKLELLPASKIGYHGAGILYYFHDCSLL